jgi:hypothetical protein
MRRAPLAQRVAEACEVVRTISSHTNLFRVFAASAGSGLAVMRAYDKQRPQKMQTAGLLYLKSSRKTGRNEFYLLLVCSALPTGA